jgi:PHD/YefM family antitoxin component YafN of YafNO toxin-antitoxin module
MASSSLHEREDRVRIEKKNRKMIVECISKERYEMDIEEENIQ